MLVVAVLLLLSTDAELRWLWSLIAVAAAAWTATAVWQTRRPAPERRDRLQGMELPAALYEPTDDGYVATALTIGPWDAGLQHAGPPAALLLREAERASGIDGGQTVRMAYDIFAPGARRAGPRPDVRRAARPADRAGRGRAHRRRGPAADAAVGLADAHPRRRRRPSPRASPHPAAAGPEESRPEDAAFFTEEIAYHRALEWRFASGSFNAPGPASAWTRAALRAGRPASR